MSGHTYNSVLTDIIEAYLIKDMAILKRKLEKLSLLDYSQKNKSKDFKTCKKLYGLIFEDGKKLIVNAKDIKEELEKLAKNYGKEKLRKKLQQKTKQVKKCKQCGEERRIVSGGRCYHCYYEKEESYKYMYCVECGLYRYVYAKNMCSNCYRKVYYKETKEKMLKGGKYAN